MSIQVITEPNLVVNGLDTRALAALEQVPLTLQRQDYGVVNAQNENDGSGFIRILLLPEYGSQIPLFQVGGLIYLGGGNVDHLNGVHAIRRVSFNGTYTIIGTSTPYVAPNQEGGYMNDLTARARYRFQVEVLDKNQANRLIDSAFNFYPPNTGLSFIDMGRAITDYQAAQGTPVPISLEFSLRLSQNWQNKVQGVTGTWLSITASGAGGSLRLQNCSFDGASFEVGVAYQFKFQDSQYTNGWYIVTNEASPAAFDIGLLFVSGATGGGSFADFDLLDPSQSIIAEKGQYTVGGSRMWEYLLRQGTTAPDTAFSSVGAGGADPNWAFLAVGSGNVGNYTTGDIVEFTTNDGKYIKQVGYIAGTGSSSITVYLPFAAYDAGAGVVIASKGKLLTRFENPLLWRGWARTVSYLIDSQAGVRKANLSNTTLRFDRHNINKGYISGTSVQGGLDVSIVSIDFPDPETADFVSARVQLNPELDAGTEQLFYRVLPECDNPIMLEWFNTLGAFESHLFSYNQEVNTEAEQGLRSQRPITQDLALGDTRTKGRIRSEYYQRMLLTAESLTPDQYEALAEIKYSNGLWIWLDKQGTERLPVVAVGDLISTTNTRDNLKSIQIAIELPDGVIFDQVKKY